ncbi:hypothetical protein N9Y81_04870, partial [Akkermansiaceae bacterium]|nr:hypothetical protein [Akkermansiaceae bacterium]
MFIVGSYLDRGEIKAGVKCKSPNRPKARRERDSCEFEVDKSPFLNRRHRQALNLCWDDQRSLGPTVAPYDGHLSIFNL